MQTRYGNSPAETAQMSTQALRDNFLIENLFQENKITLTYSLYDRMIIGGILPINESLTLGTYSELKSEYFLERREIGIINIGGNGSIIADGEVFTLEKYDCLYAGKGVQNLVFSSQNAQNPAQFYFLSCPAHATFPTRLMKAAEASPTEMGSQETANMRSINKYIHLEGIRSCQLVLGLTQLAPGSVWNTMPTHVHDRRMEAYLYFDLPENQKVMHLMGQPSETRHLVMGNQQAVISPPWSIHSGCGTSNYSFIWGMAGENQVYQDMDAVNINDLR